MVSSVVFVLVWNRCLKAQKESASKSTKLTEHIDDDVDGKRRRSVIVLSFAAEHAAVVLGPQRPVHYVAADTMLRDGSVCILEETRLHAPR